MDWEPGWETGSEAARVWRSPAQWPRQHRGRLAWRLPKVLASRSPGRLSWRLGWEPLWLPAGAVLWARAAMPTVFRGQAEMPTPKERTGSL